MLLLALLAAAGISCDLDTALIDAARHGDRSAVVLLEQRYATASTVSERFRIGGALLGRVRDDSAIWSELSAHAERLVTADGDPKKHYAYCAEHGYEAEFCDEMLWDAFAAITGDRRARPLLLRAIDCRDPDLFLAGIAALTEQHDELPLKEIEAAIRRHPGFAGALAASDSEAIKALAMKVLNDDGFR